MTQQISFKKTVFFFLLVFFLSTIYLPANTKGAGEDEDLNQSIPVEEIQDLELPKRPPTNVEPEGKYLNSSQLDEYFSDSYPKEPSPPEMDNEIEDQ
jgi:hypothetical protein